MLDGTTLQLKGEVKGAYRGTAYGLTLDEKTQKIYVGGRDYINEIDARTQQVVRTIPLNAPQLASAQNLIVDSDSGRIFVVAFDHDDRSGPHDGLYIFDLKDGKSLGYVRTGVAPTRCASIRNITSCTSAISPAAPSASWMAKPGG